MISSIPLRIKDYKQTCPSFPSQWEGHLDDGRMFYVRYRSGNLTVQVSPSPTDDGMEAVRGEYVYSQAVGDEWDGVMDWDQVIYLTPLTTL